ncbi:MAG: hypothetical protein Fur0010_18960 [Bdellovibrio sp.]
MLKILFFTILLWNYTFAAEELSARSEDVSTISDQEKIILSTLWTKAGHREELIEIDDAPKDQEIEPTPTPMPTPKKELSAGEKKIQEMLAKNKARLKEMREEEKQNESQSTDQSLQAQSKRKLLALKRQVKDTRKEWYELRNETLKKWAQARKTFLQKELPVFKEQTFSFESMAPILSKKQMSSKLKSIPKDEVVLAKNSLSLPIKSQGQRPTCAAFSAIRAIETVLVSNEQYLDLSEQYFYYASKPTCQSSPCNERGSWVIESLKTSQKSSRGNIPLEQSCPYNPSPVYGNETQIPLTSSCQQGSIKVSKFDLLNSLDQVVDHVKKGRPVIAGFRLTPNFYETEGLVTLADSNKVGKTDQHAGGHAVSIIGLMKLPESLTKSEGPLCFIIANSWGEGYGSGGYACLTYNWVQTYRVNNAFVSISSVRKY